jgi:hypothetical protein
VEANPTSAIGESVDRQSGKPVRRNSRYSDIAPDALALRLPIADPATFKLDRLQFLQTTRPDEGCAELEEFDRQ